VNYIAEINEFRKFIKKNPDLSPGAIDLWYGLMDLCNKEDWPRDFTASVTDLIDATHMSKSAIYRAKDELVSFGLILFSSPGGKLHPIFSVVSQIGKQAGTQSPVVSQIGKQAGTQPILYIQTNKPGMVGSVPGTRARTKRTKISDLSEEQKAEIVMTWEQSPWSRKPTASDLNATETWLNIFLRSGGSIHGFPAELDFGLEEAAEHYPNNLHAYITTIFENKFSLRKD
jgi:hypothetical protein